MAAEGEGRVFSAAQAKRGVTKRVKRERLIAAPATYNIKDGATTHEGLRFKQVTALCPNISTSTLLRRLEQGLRDLVELRKKPTKAKPFRMKR
jgi:hypothetical protein